jgi:hypothetical protein
MYRDSLRAERSREPFSCDSPSNAAMGACNAVDTGLLQGIRRPERGINHPPASSSEIKKRVELYLYSHSVPSWNAIG